MNALDPKEVLDFWFDYLSPEQWWKKDPEVDQLIAGKFSEIHNSAINGELFGWRKTSNGRLAEVIVLDQFSRNIYRDDPRAFAYDGMALVLSQSAIEQGADLELQASHRLFLYMPFMHSESAIIHEQAVELFTALGLPLNLDFELQHKAIIDKFGRYPHRNEILSRTSTAAEIEFLKQPNSSF